VALEKHFPRITINGDACRINSGKPEYHLFTILWRSHPFPEGTPSERDRMVFSASVAVYGDASRQANISITTATVGFCIGLNPSEIQVKAFNLLLFRI